MDKGVSNNDKNLLIWNVQFGKNVSFFETLFIAILLDSKQIHVIKS